jgi:hypothetical protein
VGTNLVKAIAAMGLMVVVKRWFRNRWEARFRPEEGRVSYPLGKAPRPAIDPMLARSIPLDQRRSPLR